MPLQGKKLPEAATLRQYSIGSSMALRSCAVRVVSLEGMGF
jgi:hypothetical protein